MVFPSRVKACSYIFLPKKGLRTSRYLTFRRARPQCVVLHTLSFDLVLQFTLAGHGNELGQVALKTWVREMQKLVIMTTKWRQQQRPPAEPCAKVSQVAHCSKHANHTRVQQCERSALHWLDRLAARDFLLSWCFVLDHSRRSCREKS